MFLLARACLQSSLSFCSPRSTFLRLEVQFNKSWRGGRGLSVWTSGRYPNVDGVGHKDCAGHSDLAGITTLFPFELKDKSIFCMSCSYCPCCSHIVDAPPREPHCRRTVERC